MKNKNNNKVTILWRSLEANRVEDGGRGRGGKEEAHALDNKCVLDTSSVRENGERVWKFRRYYGNAFLCTYNNNNIVCRKNNKTTRRNNKTITIINYKAASHRSAVGQVYSYNVLYRTAAVTGKRHNDELLAATRNARRDSENREESTIANPIRRMLLFYNVYCFFFTYYFYVLYRRTSCEKSINRNSQKSKTQVYSTLVLNSE